jgi:MFS family permease
VAAFLDLSVLREGQLGRIVLAQLASLTGDFLVIAALPAAVSMVGGQIGSTFAVEALAMALFFVVGGVAGDRFSRRKVAIAADLLCFGSQAVLAILLIRGDAEYWQLLLAQVLHGAGAGLFLPAMTGLVPQTVALEQLQEANALRGVSRSLGAIAGPMIAAVIFAIAANPGWAFAADAATFMVSALLLRGFREAGSVREATRSVIAEVIEGWSEFGADIVEGWSEFRQRTWLWVVVSEFAILNTLVFPSFFVIGPVVALESLGGRGDWAMILAAMGAGELIGSFVAKVWRPAQPLLAATLVVALWGVPLALMAMRAPVAFVAAGAALGGGALTVFLVLWETSVQSVPAGLRSRLSSYDFVGSRGLVPVGFFVGGMAQERLGSEPALAAGLGILVAAVSIVALVPSVSQFKPEDIAGESEDGRGGNWEAVPQLREVALAGDPR